MNELHRFSIRHPVLVITIATLLTVASAAGIGRLRLRTDGHDLIPQGAPEVVRDREVRADFGIRDPLLVLIRPRDPAGILNPRTLELVVALTDALPRVPGLDSTHVRSLATETGDHFRPGKLDYRRLLEPVPETPAALAILKSDLDSIGIYSGTFVSFDRRATAILVGTPPGVDRTRLLRRIEQVIGRADTAGHEIHVIGSPVAEALLGAHILEDLGVSQRGIGRPERLADRSAEGLSPIARLRLAIARHLGLLPLSVLVMALIFAVCFRSFVAVLLPLLEAGACLVAVFGLMGWTGVPVYLTMAVLPVILVSMGLADEIHVFTRYRQHREARPGAPVTELTRRAMDEMCLPIVATAFTTAIGFLSFAISPLGPVQAFGLFTAIGIVFCMLWTLTVIPAMIVKFAPGGVPATASSRRPNAVPRPGVWRALASAIQRRPYAMLALAAVGLALTPLGIRKLVVQDSWISGFAPESAFYRATQYFNRNFFGAHLFQIALDTGHVAVDVPVAAGDLTLHELTLPASVALDPATLVGCTVHLARRPAPGTTYVGPRIPYQPVSWESMVETAALHDGRIVLTTPMRHGSAMFMLQPAARETLALNLRSRRLALPDVLRRIDDLERFIRSQVRYTVGGVLGPPDWIATASYLTSRRDPESRAIPSGPDQVSLMWSALESSLGRARMREITDPGLERGLVTAFLRNANYVDSAHLMAAVREYARTHLEPERIRIAFAGDVPVSQALIGAIVSSQMRSLAASLLGILAVIAILFRSLRWGTICMVPAGLSVAATFAVMGAFGMPLGVATSMFAGMVLGIGVDFAIHLVEHFRLETGRGADRTEAIRRALELTGPAIVINGLAVALGFGILVLSRVPANAALGAITVVSLVTCLIATLLVIPALLEVAGGGGKPSGGRMSDPRPETQ